MILEKFKAIDNEDKALAKLGRSPQNAAKQAA